MENDESTDPRSHELGELYEEYENFEASQTAFDREFDPPQEPPGYLVHLTRYYRSLKHKPTSFLNFLQTYVSRSDLGDPTSDLALGVVADRRAPARDADLYEYLQRRLPYRALTALERAWETYLERR